MSESQIERLLAEADEYGESDRMVVELADLRKKIEGLIYTTERAVDEMGNFLTEDELLDVRGDLDVARQAAVGQDLEAIRAALKNLERSSFRLTEVMYQDVS
jgi:molecular chaperone DnaK